MNQTPTYLPPLFSGDRLVVYGLLKSSENASQDGEIVVRLQGTLNENEKVDHLITFPTPSTSITTDAVLDPHSSAILHCLAAKKFIQMKQDDLRDKNGDELEDGKSPIITVSKSANVASKFTSFVAVDKENCQPVSGPLTKRIAQSLDVFYASTSRYVFPCKCRRGKGFFSFLSTRRSSFRRGASQSTKSVAVVVALISLKSASGAWDFTNELVALCGNRTTLIKSCSTEIAFGTAKGKLLWATALALVLLSGKFLGR